MRTPNTACLICGKPLYRRPYELARVRHVACMEHRAEAQKVSGITLAQQAGMALGRQKGTNHRAGYKHRPESRRKASESHKRWCAANPDRVAARAEKSRGENHYKWKGGVSQFNQSIRLLTEHRKWMDGVKDRDGWACVRCGSNENPESHHIRPLADILREYGITSREAARRCVALWDVSNGETLCRRCHYAEHGRMPRCA